MVEMFLYFLCIHYYYFWVTVYGLFKLFVPSSLVLVYYSNIKLFFKFLIGFNSKFFCFSFIFFFKFLFSAFKFFMWFYIQNFIFIIFNFWFFISYFFFSLIFVVVITSILMFLSPYAIIGIIPFILFQSLYDHRHFNYGYKLHIPESDLKIRIAFSTDERAHMFPFYDDFMIRRLNFWMCWVTGTPERMLEGPGPNLPIFFISFFIIICLFSIVTFCISFVYTYFVVIKLIVFNFVRYVIQILFVLSLSIKNSHISVNFFDFMLLCFFLFVVITLSKNFIYFFTFKPFKFFNKIFGYFFFIFGIPIWIYWSTFVLIAREHIELCEFIFIDETEYVLGSRIRTHYPSLLDW